MKKRIISMLLAVCMVIACTLAITPSVSAEATSVQLTVGSAHAAIGDTVILPVTINAVGIDGDFEWNALFAKVNKVPGTRLVAVYNVTDDYTKFDVGEEEDCYNIGTMNMDPWETVNGEEIIELEYKVVSSVSKSSTFSFELNSFNYNNGLSAGSYVNITEVIPGTITVSGSVPHDITYSYELVYDSGDELINCNKTAAGKDPITNEVFVHNGGKNACSYRLIQLNLTSNAGSDVAYFDADAVENLYDDINGKIQEEYDSEIGFNLKHGKEGGTSTNKAEYVYVRFNLPNNVYFDANVDNAYFAEGENPLIEMVMRNSSNVVFLGDYDSGLPAGFEFDEDDYSYYLDNFCFDVTAPDECINVLTWKGNGLYNYLTSDTVREHMFDVAGIEAEYLSFKPLDEFKPMGYQLPTAESKIKGFRIDSEIRYADMMLDEEQVYQSAAVDFNAKVYYSDDAVKQDNLTMHKDIPTVYKRISSKNGPAIAESDGYYFSAVTVKGLDTAGLEEGEYIVFEVINSVTNCFEATTQSDPVYFKYSFDGSVVQLTDEEIPAEFVSEE